MELLTESVTEKTEDQHVYYKWTIGSFIWVTLEYMYPVLPE